MNWYNNSPKQYEANAGNYIRLILDELNDTYQLLVYIDDNLIACLCSDFKASDPEQAKERAENILMNFVHDVVAGIGGER